MCDTASPSPRAAVGGERARQLPDGARRGGRPASVWQLHDGRTAAVLYEVFGWLSGRQLAAAGSVCRAWRRAAAAPALWRRLLLRWLPAPGPAPARGWRQEYVDARAGWATAAREPAAGALHAALAPGDARLALAGAAGVALWARRAGRWAPAGGARLEARGWSGAVRAHWPKRAADRLLVIGELALVPSWELLVLHFDEAGSGRVVAHARCSAGAGGCWADAAGGAFLSLELSALAPRLAATTVWLNAASQETESEHAGVRAPLLRIFNEDCAHIMFAAVARVPPGAGVLVAASGAGGGALAAWTMTALRPPPVRAHELGDLRERVRRRAARPPSPPEDPPPPDEATVRALCREPDAVCALPALPVGFLVHPNERCVWVSLTDGGACCAELPTLRVLRRLPPPTPPPAPPVLADRTLLHYVQPSVSDEYFVSPRGSHAGGVGVWRARSGVPARAPPAHHAPALAALLLPAPAPDPEPALEPTPPAPAPAPAELLVLAGEHLYVWQSRSVPQPADESLRPAHRAL